MCATTVTAGLVLLILMLLVCSTTTTRIICPAEKTSDTSIVIRCNRLRHLTELTDEEFIRWTFPSSIEMKPEAEENTLKYKNITVLLENNNLQNLQKIPWNSSQQTITWITRLSFKRNRLVNLTSGVFQHLDQMKYLDLSYNLLSGSTLIANVFRGTQINNGGYESLPLEEMNLANNNISTLNADVFSYLPHLKSLTLSNNPIRKMVPDLEAAISSLTTLQILNLDDTLLSSLPDSLFAKNPMAISEIHLSGNFLTDVPKCLQNLASSLRKLNLNANFIREIHSKSFDKLSNIVELHLNGMSTLKKIKENAFSPLTKLRILQCSHNKNLGTVDDEAFAQLKNSWNLQELYFSNNNLRYLSESTVVLDKLHVFHMDENPWNCTCSLYWLMKFINSRQYYDPESNIGMRCEYPVELNRKTLMYAYSVVKCSINSSTPSESNNSIHFIPYLISISFLIAVILISTGLYFITRRIKRANMLKSRYSLGTGMKSITKYKLAELNDFSETD